MLQSGGGSATDAALVGAVVAVGCVAVLVAVGVGTTVGGREVGVGCAGGWVGGIEVAVGGTLVGALVTVAAGVTTLGV